MFLNLTEDMSYEKMTEAIKKALPQYEVELLKNPIAKFQYIQIKKTGMVGLWVRLIEKKNHVMLIKAMPSAHARAFLGFIFLIIKGKELNEVMNQVADVIKKEFNTTEKQLALGRVFNISLYSNAVFS